MASEGRKRVRNVEHTAVADWVTYRWISSLSYSRWETTAEQCVATSLPPWTIYQKGAVKDCTQNYYQLLTRLYSRYFLHALRRQS